MVWSTLDRYRTLPRRDWLVASTIVVLFSALRLARTCQTGDSFWWVPLFFLSYLLLGLNYLGLRYGVRQRAEIRRLEAEKEAMEREIAELLRLRSARTGSGSAGVNKP